MPKEYFKMSATNRRLKTLQRFHATLSPLVFALLLALLLLPVTPTEAAVHSVFTYKNASSELGQLVTSSTLVWETYDQKSSKQLQYAVEGGKYVTEDEHYPIYVCRVNIDGVTTSGHTEKISQAHKCVAAHEKHGKYDTFDVLVNKGHLGKIAWKKWRKFSAGVPVGAIRIGGDAYIARHHSPHHHQHQHQHQDGDTSEHSEHRGSDFNLGRLDPVGLGKIKVMENERQKDYDDGEVLVETEPFRYELRDIKLDTIRMDQRDNITELAAGVLANTGEKYSMVETVMSYDYDHMQYWGAHEGVARGLPTKIYEKDASVHAEINWGLKYSEKRYETKGVNTKLWPGTAINVTLKGNYITMEAPYTAKLYAFYYGSEDSVSRKISSEVRKGYLKDVKLEFSPVYWLENGTLVPTTTTTTTSTTSTTTHATTTSTREPTPMHEPPVVHMEHIGGLESTINEIPDNLSDNKTAVAGITQPRNKGSDGVAQMLSWTVGVATLCCMVAMLHI